MKKIASKIAKELLKHRSRQVIDFSLVKKANEKAVEDLKTVKKAKDLIDQGYDPQFAVYTEAQNLISLIVEQVSTMSAFDKINKKSEAVYDDFMPSWPPMSPISTSYFVHWHLFDLKVGLDKESYFSCIYSLSKVMNFDPFIVKLWALMDQSRLGVYKVLRSVDDKVLLEEIFTNKQYLCYTPNNHPINPGELWLVRLLPKADESFNYHIIFASAYVLMAHQKDWEEFFDCNVMGIRGTENCEKNYESFMQTGLTDLYWLEYIFQAYGKHTDLVIYLYGLPDLAKSRPHVSFNGRLPERKEGNRVF